MRNVEKEIIQITLSGDKFDIPLHYMYGASVEKWGGWRKVKKERTTVDYLNLSMLLPDLQPYYLKDDSRWKILGHGERIEVGIRSFDEDGSSWFRTISQRISDSSFTIKSEDEYNLNHFSGGYSETYFPAEDVELIMTCYHKTELRTSPGCRVTTPYRAGIQLSYSYGVSYLPLWREIDADLKTLLDNFRTK